MDGTRAMVKVMDGWMDGYLGRGVGVWERGNKIFRVGYLYTTAKPHCSLIGADLYQRHRSKATAHQVADVIMGVWLTLGLCG